MTTSSPDSLPHSSSKGTNEAKVPRSLFIIIVVLLAGLYSYAAFIDKPEPEKTVEDFYQAYLTRDFDTVARQLSVFWSVRFLPESASKSPAELLQSRPAIEKEISAVLTDIESTNTMPEDISVEIMKSYTKIGENSAIVVYSFNEKGQTIGMEAAILIKEEGRFRIFNMSPLNEAALGQIEDMDISALDESFSAILHPAPTE